MATLRFEAGSTVTPGDRIGSVRQISPGVGCYTRGANVYSSAVGKLLVQTQADALPVVSVSLKPGHSYASSRVLNVGQIVLGRVVRLTWQQAIVEIVAGEGCGTLAKQEYQGAIRVQDVRAGASEEVELQDSFQPGDVVLCRIVSLGDSRRYFLSTAETELGVVRATCRSSQQIMVPISWKETQCPETNVKEPRKCAKAKGLANLFSTTTTTANAET